MPALRMDLPVFRLVFGRVSAIVIGACQVICHRRRLNDIMRTLITLIGGLGRSTHASLVGVIRIGSGVHSIWSTVDGISGASIARIVRRDTCSIATNFGSPIIRQGLSYSDLVIEHTEGGG